MIRTCQFLIFLFAISSAAAVIAQPSKSQDKPSTIKMLPIPDADKLARVSGSKRPSREVRRNSAFVLQTDEHAVTGTRYVVLTDHTEQAYLDSLKRLADHYDGTVIQVEDLATLYKNKEEFSKLRKQLVDEKAKWVAIAPRKETFRENMLLGMWKLLSTLDDDREIDVFPGVLLASNAEAFAKLIDQSIDHKPQPLATIKPVAISQVLRTQELRSLQKAGILRKLFAKMDLETPIVGIYGERAEDAPHLEGDKTWSLKTAGRKKFVKKFPEDVSQALNDSNLIVLHGHGIPGMSCSVDNDGLPEDMTGKSLFAGSCFSASPSKSDLPPMRQAPGGYEVQKRDAFVIRAIDNGALMAFGHQRLSSGFPHMFPVLEDVLAGKSAGQAYQELLNGLFELKRVDTNKLTIPLPASGPRVPQNTFLYVLIGDPALELYAGQ